MGLKYLPICSRSLGARTLAEKPMVYDVHTPEQRSRNMAAIRGKDTKPEFAVRKIAHALGYRFRLHSERLPGKPDLVFPRLKKLIFVNGCYWHMHSCRWGRVVPKTNTLFWQMKRSATVSRDRRNLRHLRAAGWQVLIIWECQTKHAASTRARIKRFLGA
jgi:DNA mismatch endonuclease (patch repair protein)